MSFKFGLAAACALVLATSAKAETCGNTGKGFNAFIKEMKREADAAGVSASSVAILNDLKYDPSIIKKDRAQNHFRGSFLVFQARKATAARIKKGQAVVAKHKALFDRVGRTIRRARPRHRRILGAGNRFWRLHG